ncbi:hypothetical protein [Massilia sp. NR 4-1]|nr:hypothetical protein [Massilia sp. NR 4-1]
MQTKANSSSRITRFLRDERGDSFYEFVMIASLSLVICFIVYLALGKSI